MALEQFKTQVLLLHSEQSTLDSLSTGFDDRYSVHCATSGTEALTTLGATPIDVIVSAQDLPGMSGLDALREAKKRSPETITFLMAGDGADEGLEALVSDKEVFQIIRGEIEPDRLRELIEDATKTARLMALADSANDTSADAGATGEHIVMETADNGSFIVSDGTGQVPVLKPEKVSPAPDAGKQQVDVLALTQDDEFLETIRASTSGTHAVHHAEKPGQAEDFVRNYPVGVLVTDASLAGSNVEALTQRLRTHRKRLVAIVAGRRDDGEMLMDLINRGHVYRFLLKPVSPGRARLAIEASVRHHREAPEHAFQGRPGPKKPELPPAPKSREQAKAATAARPASAAPAAGQPAGQPQRAAEAAAPGHGLDDAFDEPGSFTETVTGLAVSVGRSISDAASGLAPSRRDASKTGEPESPRAPIVAGAPSAADPKAANAPIGLEPADGSSGSLFNAKTLGIAAAVVIAVAAGFALFSGGDEPAELPQAVVDTADPVVDRAVSAAPAEPEPEPAPSVEDRSPVQAAPAATAAGDAAATIEADSREPTLALPEPVEAQPGTVEPDLAAAESVEADRAAPEPVPAEATLDPAVAGLLDGARSARAAGEVFAPAGRNAVELYVAARDAAPTNADILAELDATLEEVFGLAEAALLENRTQDASRALRVIGLAAPESPRLGFLDSQLRQQQLQSALDDTRAAIRDARFREAGQQLARAEEFAGGRTPEIDALIEELSAARDDRQLADVLALAGQRLESGQLVSPRSDSARHYFELALSIDPQSTAAQQGLLAISNTLVLRARAAIDAGALDDAEALLTEAQALDPDNAEVAAAADALQVARTPAPEPVGEPAPAADPARDAPGDAASAAPPTAAAKLNDEEAAAQAAAAVPTVSITALKRIHYVPPKYPRGAQRRNQSGYVDVLFTVTPSGGVADMEVRESEPAEVFVESALEAVSQWEFEPVIEDGQPVARRVAVRMSFNLQ